MDFNFSQSQLELQDRLRTFCRDHCSDQLAQELDEHPRDPQELHAALVNDGILGHCLPAAFGGGDGRIVDAVIIHQALSHASDAAVNLMFVNYICAALVSLTGNQAQKERLVAGVARGDIRMAFALTEPEAGSDAGAIQCRARMAGEAERVNLFPTDRRIFLCNNLG